MKRTLMALLMVVLLAPAAFCISDEEQNAGYLHFTTAIYTIRPDAITYIYREAPASDTTWLAGHPNCQYIVLPKVCRGFSISAFGGDLLLGHPSDLATGTVYVGTKIAENSSLKWEDLDLDQKTVVFGLIANEASTATATFCGW